MTEPTEKQAWPAGITSVPLLESDIDGALALSEEAGWNQTATDWRFMIGRGPGWGCHDIDGHLVATALTQPYGNRFGWISMVLVTPSWQRKGIATVLLEYCVDGLLNLGLTPGLDATETGRGIYLTLGFKDIYPLTRMYAESPLVAVGLGQDRSVRPLSVADLAGITRQDSSVFGGDRQDLLRSMLARAPGLAAMRISGDGYALGRDGREALHLGPVVAGSTEAAIALARTGLAGVRSPVYIDVPDHQHEFRRWLEDAGFRRQRAFIRMLYGRHEAYDDPRHVFAIAGPELG